MYCLYTSPDKLKFEWEAEAPTLPEILNEVGKWLSIRSLDIDPNIRPKFKQLSTTYYIYKGRNNVSGILVASISLEVKKFK